MVSVHVQHPPEASVKIHQVTRINEKTEQSSLQLGSIKRDMSQTGAQRKRAELYSIQAQHSPRAEVYSETAGVGYCFKEVNNEECRSPLPGLRTRDVCCRTFGIAWGVHECALCTEYQVHSADNVNQGSQCPRGFLWTDGQCQDIDECSEADVCQNGDCINTRGSFSCTCKSGFILDTSHSSCISLNVLSEAKGPCYRILREGLCTLPILRNITKQICCCSRVGRAWGQMCERCPPFGSEGFKEICPAGPGYHYSPSDLRISQRALDDRERQRIPVISHAAGQPKATTAMPTRSVIYERKPPGRVVVIPPTSSTPSAAAQPQSTTTSGPKSYVCQLQPRICGPGLCIPQQSGYTCLCNTGFMLNTRKTHCVDVNECENRTICPDQECINTAGSFKCVQCRPGYRIQNGKCTDINECRQTPHPCTSGACENTPGSFRCRCPSGFLLDSQKTNCIDMDECHQTPHPCTNGECENTPGSFRCRCLSGFQLDSQTTTCVDIDECHQTPHPCTNGACENTPGSFRCRCTSGFRFDSQMTTCVDIDECHQTAHPCTNGACENTPGSFHCRCPSGFRLDSQTTTCVDIDECRQTPRPCTNGACENTPGSFHCRCLSGFRLDSQTVTCVDIDECQETPQPCTNGRCENLMGAYRCLCQAGFRLNQQGTECVDIDECNQIPRPCANGQCENTASGYRCLCPRGFRPNTQGTDCVDIDECSQSPSVCNNGRCENTAGSYRCLCSTGFQFHSLEAACVDIDECSQNTSPCKAGHCENTAGSYRCQCARGFQLNSQATACIDVDECLTGAACGLNGRCINSEGSFRCDCKLGYRQKNEGAQCTDVNECFEQDFCFPHGECLNTEGSYRCLCSEGFHVSLAGNTCEDINECANASMCDEHAVCLNVIGSYQCQCGRGYELSAESPRCIDVDECKTVPRVCDLATCKNTEGSFLCICPHEKEEFDPITGKCIRPTQTGVQISTSRTRDSRPLEMSDNSSDCYYSINDVNACANILARNISRDVCCCTAGQGWGANCQVQPCPVPGSAEHQHLCPRGIGYILTGRGAFATYTDADECKLFHSTICKGGFCVNHISGYSCYCPTGYYYNSLLLECADHDECQDEDTCLGGRCSNTIGSYYCTCTPPLVLDSSQHQCVTNTTEIMAQNVGLCWQELGEHWVCSRPLLERQITYAECCCHFGNAWGIDCALCPLRDTDDYAYLCSPARSAGPLDTESYDVDHESRPGSYPTYDSNRLNGRSRRPLYSSESTASHSYGSRPFLPPPLFGRQDSMYEGRTYETAAIGSDFAYLSPEGDSRTTYGARDSLHQPVYEQPSFQGSTGFRPRITQSDPVYNPDESRSWLRYSGQETPSFRAYPDRSRPGIRTDIFEERYEQFEGLRHEECGILNGCENGRCIRVPDGYTCDCSDGYRLDIAQMACVDIDECVELGDPSTLCVNGQCVNTAGSYHCVCLSGFVMSRQQNYCIPAHPRV